MPRPGSCPRLQHLSAATRSSGLGGRSPGMPTGTPTPPRPPHQGDMFGTASPNLLFQLPLGPALTARPEAGSRATQGLGFGPNSARAPPGPPAALPRPATGGEATHQDQAPPLTLGLGQGTSTLRSLQPESRDSPGPGQPRSLGPLALAAARPEADVHCSPQSQQPTQGVPPRPPCRTRRTGPSRGRSYRPPLQRGRHRSLYYLPKTRWGRPC